jgi:hypothetical protein
VSAAHRSRRRSSSIAHRATGDHARYQAPPGFRLPHASHPQGRAPLRPKVQRQPRVLAQMAVDLWNAQQELKDRHSRRRSARASQTSVECDAPLGLPLATRVAHARVSYGPVAPRFRGDTA